MNAKQVDSNDPKKMRKMDKPPPPSYREYLDMDTDEEEFGRQETPEDDEELPPEPEKPIFTKGELAILVQYVKNLTILPISSEIDFSPNCITMIEEYFKNPGNTILTITHKGTECNALLYFPCHNFQNLTYFLRAPWQIFTPENFMSTVIFGSLNENLENSILKFLEIMFAPIAFHSNEWPGVMKDQVFSNLNQFLICLTDATFTPMGLTILYVSREGVQNVDNETEESNNEKNEKGFIERLERVARNWIKQIRGALCGGNLLPRPTCTTIIEQIEFWNYKYENLSCLYNQLNSTCVMGIIRQLEDVKSVSILPFHSLVNEVQKLLAEATSNIIYLNLFVEYCHEFDIPDGIEEYSIKILHLIRFVESESEFYNSTEKIDALCQALGTQIIYQCKNYIGLDVVLKGDPNKGKLTLENCINACTEFLNIFDQFVLTDKNFDHPTFSKVNKKITFCHIDIFMQRCQNLIEISNARIVFDRCKKVKMIPGAKSFEHEKQYQKIEHLFSETLSDIIKIQACILDVTQFIWLECIVNFNSKIEDIDNMLQNLIHEIFKDVGNIDEGIEALYAFKRFVLRPNLKETLNLYWTRIWKIFETELEYIINSLNDESNLGDISMTEFAGSSSLMRIKYNYLATQFNMLIDATDWFGDNNCQQEIIEKYKRVQSALSEKEKVSFESWEKGLESEIVIENILNEPVLKFCDYPNESFMRVNLNKNYLENMRAKVEWKILKYDDKTMSSKPLKKWKSLKYRYNKVEFLCNSYNSTINQWSKVEWLLFKNILNDIKIIISSSLPKNTWICDSIEKFYLDCLSSISQLKEEANFFKKVNLQFKSLCKEISTTLLVIGTENLTYSLQDFEKYLKTIKEKNFSEIKNTSRSIVDSILLLKQRVQYGDVTPSYWKIYVQEIVAEFKQSIVKNVRGSFQSALEFFYGDFLTIRKPLLKISVDYFKDDEKKIRFVPDILEIERVFEDLIGLTSDEAYLTEEFIGILKCDVDFEKRKNFIESDESVLYLWNQLDQEIDLGLEGLMEFVESLEILKDISNIQEAVNVSSHDDKREMLETKIVQCEQIVNLITSLNNEIRIRYFLLNTKELKSKVLTDCEYFKDMLFVELSKFIALELTLERMPMQCNNDFF